MVRTSDSAGRGVRRGLLEEHSRPASRRDRTFSARGSAAAAVSALVAGAVLSGSAVGLGTAVVTLLAFDGMRDNSGYVSSPVVRASSSAAAVTADGIMLVDATDCAIRYDHTAGTILAVSAPAGQDFWLASASATQDATLRWQAAAGGGVLSAGAAGLLPGRATGTATTDRIAPRSTYHHLPPSSSHRRERRRGTGATTPNPTPGEVRPKVPGQVVRRL